MYQFIVNPTAGAGRGYRIWKRLERQLERESGEYQVFFTERQQDAAEIAKRLTAEKFETMVLIVVGGEGTYNEVLNGVSFKGLLTFGYIPVGFRNILSRGFCPSWHIRGQMKRILYPKCYRLQDYGVMTSGGDEIFSRRFAARCGIGLDAAICHNLLSCRSGGRFANLRVNRLLPFFVGLKQLFLARPSAGYVIFDGMKRVEFNQIYFISFLIQRDSGKKKKGEPADDDGGRMSVYVACTASRRHMIPILLDVIMGVRKKERGVRVFECQEASVHLEKPLAVHVDGESCLCQQDIEVRCIPKRIRMIGL